MDGVEQVPASRQKRDQTMSKISMLFQGLALFDSLKIWENVGFELMRQRGLSKREIRSQAIEKLDIVGMGKHVADLYPAEISGGMKRRVALARAIICDPEIIFFDEPTTGLDPIMGTVINKLIRECVTNLGVTAIMITHDIESARYVADNVGLIYDGQIVWRGTAAEMDKSHDPYIYQFTKGSSQGPIQPQL